MGSTNSGKASWPAAGPFSGQVWLHGFDMPNFCPQQYPRRALRITVHEFLSLTTCKKRWNSGLQEEHETLRFFSGNKHHYCCGRLCYLKRIKKQHRSAGSWAFQPAMKASPAFQNHSVKTWPPLLCFTLHRTKPQKLSKIMPANLLLKRTRIWWLNWKNKIFLSSLCLALSLQNQNY